MADERKPASPFAEALKSDPHDNARLAEELMDSAKRRETEEAQRNREDATDPKGGPPVPGTTTQIPPG